MPSLATTAVVALAGLNGVNAWGMLGHATVAYVAQNYLDPEVAAWAQSVLNDTSNSYLANIASWADDYRATAAGKWSAPLHFIDAEDNPPESCNVDYERDCGPAGCVVSAIGNYTQRVGDGRLSAAHVAEALRFLVHFVGDITQPLHDEALALGGNNIKVTFNGFNDNLHSDWDTYFPEQLVGASTLEHAQGWAWDLIDDIDTGAYCSQAGSWTEGDDVKNAIVTATRWASDANAFVCSVVMPDGVDALQKGDLFPDYYNSVIGTIELQIAKGGYRLANWLNTVYAKNIAKRGLETSAAPLPDLQGRDLLPKPRPLTRAKLARYAMEEPCCSMRGEHSHGHSH
ncbi:Nuclease PA3 [Escovopsis weberi]|uniref:Nuclease PA3 n=1 Tax=Escovopsis weberi TaxID=150374 RepID=A0A0M8N7U0_ESCWE|nr:Nuclease PA3 [Escovopsis weberi]